MKALPITITLTEPLLAPALNGDPNSAVSYPFIPGSLIRGAIAIRLAQSGTDLAATERDLLFNGKTRFLNAYPVGEDGQRSLPTLLSWRRKKEQHPLKKVFDLSVGGNPEQGRKVSQPFYAPHNKGVVLYDPEKHFNVHTYRENRVMGRATEGSGAVFRYEAIAPGQTFVGTILFDDEHANEALFDDTPLLLGGSRSTAYGQVTIAPGQVKTDWREVGGQISDIADIPANTAFVVTLLSDLLMQNRHGQYTTQLTEADFTRWFGLLPQGISISQAYKAEGMVGGFNRKWGLPLNQVPVLRAGTVFVLKATSNISATIIRTLEEKGVGKRCIEGFGRITIGPKGVDNIDGMTVYEPDRKDKNQADEDKPKPVTLPDVNSRVLAQTMYTRLLSARVDDALAVFVNETVNLSPQGISSTQLSRLRVKVRGQLLDMRDNSLNDVREWLDKLRSTGRKQYEQARINNEPLLTWLQKRLQKPEDIWSVLGVNPERIPLAHVDTVDVQNISTGQFASQTTLYLIDGVLAKMEKLSKEGKN